MQIKQNLSEIIFGIPFEDLEPFEIETIDEVIKIVKDKEQ